MRIQFYMTDSSKQDSSAENVYKDQLKVDWIKAVRCSDFYSEQIAAEVTKGGTDFFTYEFSDLDWICPDTTNLNIGPNPYEV